MKTPEANMELAQSMPGAALSTRIWMLIAFMAGVVLTALLAQMLSGYEPRLPAPGAQDSIKPAEIPADGYLVKLINNRPAHRI